jgi:hypothetical protein
MFRSYRLISLGLLASCVAGCKYDGAFMQMDSNAPFPFFGFQLAVDSGVRPERSNASGSETRRREDIVPLREHSNGEFDVPIPRLQQLHELSPGRGTPPLPVRLGR